MTYDVGVFTRRRIISPAESYFAVPASVAGFTPASLPNLVGWYKADDGPLHSGVAPANGETITSWVDQSGGSQTLTSISLFGHYVTGGLNGKAVVAFADAGNEAMRKTSFPLGGTKASVFMVCKTTASSAGSVRLAGYTGTGGSDIDSDAAIFWHHPGGTLTMVRAYQNGNQSTGTIVSGSWNQLGCIYDGTNSTVYVGGTPATPVSCTTSIFTNGTFLLFCDESGGNNPAGQVAEIIVCKDDLTSNVTAITTYLNGRWGV